MSVKCEKIHKLVNSLKRHAFPFADSAIPSDGVYILFQKGEEGHGNDRIVRVGTHTADAKLLSRLKQHFIRENKDSSIFRKNIGRAFLNKENDPFLKYWNIKMSTKEDREKYSGKIDFSYQKKMEERVSVYIRSNFSFSVIKVNSREERLDIEKKLIGTVSWCNECGASENWLGRYSPVRKIAESGLWLVNGVYGEVFGEEEVERIGGN